MQNADAILAIYNDRGMDGKCLEGIYRQLFNPELYLRAYGRLYSNAGAMTKGTTEETVDGMSIAKIEGIIQLIRKEQYEWTPVRRVLIPKGNGKTRPLGIPTWTDKLLQEVMRSLLEAYYEPQFSPHSHGFRPGRGCHTALRDVFHAWTGTKWFIEGDIKGCFDNIDHRVLLTILQERIHDGRFISLVQNLLEAGYLEDWTYRPTHSGTPQGGIISPLLSNIYMDRLDKFVENTLIPEYNHGKRRRQSKESYTIYNRIAKLKREGASEEEIAKLRRLAQSRPQRDQFDPDYRRLRYIRYADDFLLGFAGPREEAEAIKVQLQTFLRDNLKLELSAEKTLITDALTGKAAFLGYDVSADGPASHGKGHGGITLRIPIKKLEEKIARYTKDGKPIHRNELQDDSDFAIVEKYGAEYRGIVQYYAYARNRWWLHRLCWVMETSLLKTLAKKHRSSVAEMARRFAGRTIDNGARRCINVTIPREGKQALYAQFGGLSLRLQPFHAVEIEDRLTDVDRHVPRKELLTRLLMDTCELCGSTGGTDVHHIRKLADLKVKGRKEAPAWAKTMSALKRKTLVVCERCHVAIHAGQPTGMEGSQ
jgi:group II intron reverse transcriptase/maturase